VAAYYLGGIDLEKCRYKELSEFVGLDLMD